MEFFSEGCNVKETARKFNDVSIHSFSRDTKLLTLEANKLILASYSTYFEQIFQSRSFQSFIDIIITETSYEVVKLILELMYDGRVYVRHEFCSEFKKAVMKFKIKTGSSDDQQKLKAARTFVLTQTFNFPDDCEKGVESDSSLTPKQKLNKKKQTKQQQQMKQQQQQQMKQQQHPQEDSQIINPDTDNEKGNSKFDSKYDEQESNSAIDNQEILKDLSAKSKDFIKQSNSQEVQEKRDKNLKRPALKDVTSKILEKKSKEDMLEKDLNDIKTTSRHSGSSSMSSKTSIAHNDLKIIQFKQSQNGKKIVLHCLNCDFQTKIFFEAYTHFSTVHQNLDKEKKELKEIKETVAEIKGKVKNLSKGSMNSDATLEIKNKMKRLNL